MTDLLPFFGMLFVAGDGLAMFVAILRYWERVDMRRKPAILLD